MTSLLEMAEFWLAIKWILVMGLFLYIFFSVMVVRQVGLMSRALNGAFKAPLKFLAWGYLGATVATFLTAILIL